MFKLTAFADDLPPPGEDALFAAFGERYVRPSGLRNARSAYARAQVKFYLHDV